MTLWRVLLLPAVLAFLTVPLRRMEGKSTLRSILSTLVPIPVSNAQDTQYYIESELGTPGQEFNLMVDTGSANLWVPSSNCYSMPCWTHNCYTSSQSSTYQANGTFIQIDYASGVCSGVLSQDVFSIGGLTVQNVTFAQMDVMSRDFTYTAFDGILGLGPQALSISNVPTVFSQITLQQLIPDPSFSLYLTPDSSGSQLLLGGLDSSLYTGSLQYHKTAKDDYWSVSLASIYLNDDKKSLSDSIAILDSGASIIAGDSYLISYINSYIGTIPSNCNGISNLPTLTIEIDDYQYKLTPGDYVLNSTNGCVSPFQTAESWVEGVEHFLVLGQPFLRKYFSQFSFSNNTIGLAPANS